LRIHVLSDLHNEFEPYNPSKVDCDVVVLAGDLGLGMNGLKWIDAVLQQKTVIYVAGNHEYYGNALPRLTNKLSETCQGTSVRFLECESVSFNGVRFLGCTLWSDFGVVGNRSASMDTAQNVMTDYRRIRVSPKYRKLRPMDTAALHAASVKWLQESLMKPSEPTIVVTHHAPSPRSLKPGTEKDPVSGAYASRLDDWIETSSILLWVHGHTHHCVDYTIGSTRILSNQRGYPDEPAEGFQPSLVVDI
jgi:Icc-related predicted phosphoesterase